MVSLCLEGDIEKLKDLENSSMCLDRISSANQQLTFPQKLKSLRRLGDL